VLGDDELVNEEESLDDEELLDEEGTSLLFELELDVDEGIGVGERFLWPPPQPSKISVAKSNGINSFFIS